MTPKQTMINFIDKRIAELQKEKDKAITDIVVKQKESAIKWNRFFKMRIKLEAK